MDVSFYMFTLPFLRFVLGFLFAAVVLGFIAAAVVHYIYGGIRLQPADDRFSRAARAHLSILVGDLHPAQGSGVLARPLRALALHRRLRAGRDLQGRQRGHPGPDDPHVRLAVLRAAVLHQRVPRDHDRRRRQPRAAASAAALVVGTIYPRSCSRCRSSRRSCHARRRTSRTTSTRRRASYGVDTAEVVQYQAKDFATERRGQGERGHDREHPPARPGDRLADVQGAAGDPQLLRVPRLARHRPLRASTASSAAP